jgi:hypothetical protein
MDSRSYIKLTGNLTNITGATGTTGTTYVPPIEPIKYKLIGIGYWNMQTGPINKQFQAGMPLSKIRGVTATIRSDGGSLYSIGQPSGNWEVAGYVRVLETVPTNPWIDVVINDAESSFFQSSGFDSGSVCRGWVTLQYSGIQPPSGTTGTVANLTPTSFNVNGNKVTNNGGSPICQYGVVWSTNSNPTLSNGTPFYTNAVIGTNVPYNKTLSPLPDGSTIYFRQFAKNCEETGYGNICSQVTPPMGIPTDVYVGLMECYDNTTFQHKDGLITISPPLGTGQCVEVSLDFHQLAQNSGDVACIQIMKSCNGGPYYYEYPFTPPAQTTYYGEGGINQYEGNGTGTITLRKGDCACWIDDVSGPDYPNQLRSDFYISNLVGTSVTVHPDSNQYVHVP